MAQYYCLMFNVETNPVDTDKIEEVLDNLKDWLRFSTTSYLVYTGIRASELRDRLKSHLEPNSPGIIVVGAVLEGWAAFAKPTSRAWLKAERNETKHGE